MNVPNYKTYSAGKLTDYRLLEVTSHCIHNDIEYIDLFFDTVRSMELVVSKVDKIVVENIIVDKKEYTVAIDIELPAKITISDSLPIISIEFNRKTKEHKAFKVINL